MLKIKNWIGIKILTSAALYLKRWCNYAFKTLKEKIGAQNSRK